MTFKQLADLAPSEGLEVVLWRSSELHRRNRAWDSDPELLVLEVIDGPRRLGQAHAFRDISDIDRMAAAIAQEGGLIV